MVRENAKAKKKGPSLCSDRGVFLISRSPVPRQHRSLPEINHLLLGIFRKRPCGFTVLANPRKFFAKMRPDDLLHQKQITRGSLRQDFQLFPFFFLSFLFFLFLKYTTSVCCLFPRASAVQSIALAHISAYGLWA